MVDISAYMGCMAKRLILLMGATFFIAMNFVSRAFGDDLKVIPNSLYTGGNAPSTYKHRKDEIGNSTANNPRSKVFCYSCGAYRHRDGKDFEQKLKDCRDDFKQTADILECPAKVGLITTKPSCRITKQTIQGHVTSFSRGCCFLIKCRKLRFCYDNKQTGVCQDCCDGSYCNGGILLHFSWIVFLPLWAFYICSVIT